MKRLETIRPAVELAANHTGLPTYANVKRPEVGFDGDAWVWTWRQVRERQIAEVSVVARPQEAGIEIRVAGSAWMLDQRQPAASRLYYARFFDSPDFLPAVDALAAELGPPLKKAWSEAAAIADQLPTIERQQANFIAGLKEKGLLGG